MDLCIVIVSWNTRDLLAACLDSLNQHQESLQMRVFVVDNGSTDGSREMVACRFPHVKLVDSGGNIGFARANNLVLDQLQAPFVLFLNPDTEIRPYALQRMLDTLREDASIGAVSCKTLDSDLKPQDLGIQRFPTPVSEFLKLMALTARTRRLLKRWLPCHNPEQSGAVNKLYGACLMVRKEVLDRVGSFDQRFFMYCEDVDLCQRIQAAGWTLYYRADAQILHLCGSSSSIVPGAFSVLMMCESYLKLMRKYYGRAGGLVYRLAMFLGAGFRLLALLLWAGSAAMRLTRHRTRLRPLIRKYLTIALWAVGLRQALIAGAPAGTSLDSSVRTSTPMTPTVHANRQ